MSTLELFTAVAAKAGYVLLAALILLCGYRALLHPLRSYPGPFLAKVTSLYAGSAAVKKSLHLQILKDHEKYGSVVRLAPNRLVFNTVTAWRGIYQSDQIIKAYTYHSTSKDFKVNMFSERDQAAHRTKRKLIGQVLTERSMRSFEPAMTEQIDIYLSQIREASQNSTPVNMTEKARHLALDVVAKLAFGHDLNVQTRPDNRFVMGAFSFSLFRFNMYTQVDFLSYIEPTFLLDWLAKEARQKYWLLLQHMIKTRMGEEKNARADLYSVVADTLDAEPDTLYGGSMWTEAVFFMTAGGDTVASLIAATFFYLSRNPKCYRRLADEIRSTFSSGSDVKGGPQMASCTYLRACIDEALRMSPPSGSNHWREQDPADSRPLIIDGHVIPRGTLVNVSPYALQHNEAYFPDPFTFIPERWIEGDEEARKIAHDAFAAFSTGPRNCAGKPMAYLESSLVIAKTLWYFDFEAAPGHLGRVGGGTPGAKDGREKPGEYQILDVFTARHDGPYLIFRPRENVSK
ncbi:cytochrome P450 [Pestalotiopsis sp. NC0098]|nr:cytochrome P450 [Pestalotiopsis sp. NC0098]